MRDPLSTLPESRLFHGAPEAALRMVREAVNVRHYRAGSYIYREGEPAEAIYLITEGRVKLSRTNLEGKERILAILTRPEVVGELSVVSNTDRTVTARCLDDVAALAIYKHDLRIILDRYPSILWNLAAILATRLDETNREVEVLSFSTTRAVVAHALLSLYQKGAFLRTNGGELAIEFTHQDLANRTGNSRETITRVLRAMEEEGLVRTKPGTITLLRPEDLEGIIYGIGDNDD